MQLLQLAKRARFFMRNQAERRWEKARDLTELAGRTAGAIGEPGDVLVLDMGEPVKIVDVAERLIAESGEDIEINFTGLRQGEKLHEVLFSASEDRTPSTHPLVSQVRVPALDPREVAACDGTPAFGEHPAPLADLVKLA